MAPNPLPLQSTGANDATSSNNIIYQHISRFAPSINGTLTPVIFPIVSHIRSQNEVVKSEGGGGTYSCFFASISMGAWGAMIDNRPTPTSSACPLAMAELIVVYVLNPPVSAMRGVVGPFGRDSRIFLEIFEKKAWRFDCEAANSKSGVSIVLNCHPFPMRWGGKHKFGYLDSRNPHR